MLVIAADGEAIKNACIQFLTDLCIERKNLTAVTTDTAAAMRGSLNAAANSCPTGPRDLFSWFTMFYMESISRLLTC